MKKLVLVLSIGLFFISCKEDKSKKAKTKAVEKVTKTETVKNISNNVTASKITWKGYKPTGFHHGTINLKEGNLNYNSGLKGGKFILDMTSIKDLDMPETDEYSKKLVTHLTSAEFFDVTKYPTATFEITKVTKEEIVTKIEGNLTIKGITKNISFPASVTEKDGEITFLSNAIKIDRTDFGIKYKSKKFFDNLKDKFINDLFDITFEIKAKK